MTNKTKIIIATIIIIMISVCAYSAVRIKKISTTSANSLEGNNYTIEQFIDNTIGEENNKIENNSQNTVQTEVNEIKAEQNNAQKNVIGKEEEESKKENTAVNEEETAINLAKREWEIDVDSFKFEARKNEAGVYTVSVINKTTGNTETIYTVNVKTGAVTE